MTHQRRWMLAACITLVLITGTPQVWAQLDIDAALARQDESVLHYFSSSFVRDHRYDAVFTRIFARLEPHLAEVYTDPHKPVTPYVFVSTMGFNAMTWDKIIVFDSLLLDSFRRLSEGVTMYGSTQNRYCWELARAVASLSIESNRLPRLADMTHPDNLYGLPLAGTLSAREQAQADALFEEMLASWLGHEGSHAFFDHARDRLEKEQLRETYGTGHDKSALSDYVNRSGSTNNSADKEREADEKGAVLITRSGYSIHGFIVSLEFAQYLEEMTGVSSATYNQSHPPAQERILDIERVTGLGGFK